jgi:hypothetical protein
MKRTKIKMNRENPSCLRTASVAIAMCISLACAEVYAHPHPPEGHLDGPNHPAHANLAAEATNPVAPLMSLRLQYQNSPSSYNADGYSQAFVFQGVIPNTLPFEAVPRMLNRVTTPYISTPDLGSGIGRKHGFSDTSVLSFAVPDFGMKTATIGLGASIGIPTAGDNEYTGSGQWQAGPAAVYINHGTPGLQWGLLVFQNWDFASTRSDAADVSVLSLQPILTKHFSGGWYVGAPDLAQTYDFETKEWSLNLGAQVGRVFPWGKQHLQVFGAVYYNSEDNDDIVASEWTAKINVSFLLPE